LVNVLIEHVRKMSEERLQSLTWDRDKEKASHKGFTLATDIQIFS
jgi:IS30 family transposase